MEGIAGGLWQILACEVLAGRGHRLPVLSEYVSYVVLAPFVGPEEAAEAIARSRDTGGVLEPPSGVSATNGTPAADGTHAVNGTPSTNGAHAANGDARGQRAHGQRAHSNSNGNGTPSTNGTRTANGHAVNGGTPSTNGSHAANGAHAANGTNGDSPAAEDYRRLAERRSAKCVNTTPTSTDSTITTIKGA